MKRLAAFVIFLFIGFNSHAAIITDTGHSVVADNGDGTYTFTFDTGLRLMV
jgi:hypothetical protein